MINLKSLEEKLDLALSLETKESLNSWLFSVKLREMDERKFNISFYDSFLSKSNSNSEELESSNFSKFLSSLYGLVDIQNSSSGVSLLSGDKLCDPPDKDFNNDNYNKYNGSNIYGVIFFC